MATTTIHSLNYQLLMDTSKFEGSAKAVRAGLREQKKAFQSILTPAERYQVELDKLNKLQRAGLVTGEAYRRKLDQIKRQYQAGAKEATLFGRATNKLGKNLAGLVAGIGVSGFIRELNQGMERIDQINKTTAALGMSNRFLTTVQFAGRAVTGLSDESIAKGLEKMTRRLSEAAQGAGEAQNVLRELGLDAKALLDAGPEEAFRRIARAMDTVTNEHDRLRIATKLFDDEQAKLHLALKLTNAEMAEYAARGERMGVVLGEDARGVSDTAQAWSDFKTQLDGITNSLVIGLNPALKTTAELLQTIAENQPKNVGEWVLRRASPIGFLHSFASNMVARFNRPDDPAVNAAAATVRDMRTPGQGLADTFNLEQTFKNGLIAAFDYMDQFRKPRTNFGNFGGIDTFNLEKMLTNSILGLYQFPSKTRQVGQQLSPDPMASINARSSEAFKLFNRRISGDSAEQQTAQNTEKAADLLAQLLNQVTNAIPLNL